MKKLLYLFSAVTLTLTSCTTEDGPSNSSSDVLLTRTIETYDDGSTLTTNFSYNGNKLTGWSDSDGESTTFTYDGNGRLVSFVESSYDANDDLVSNNGSIIYDSNERITSIVFDSGIHYDYTYNSDGTVDEDYYDDLISGTPTLSDSYKYTISNGNIVSQVGFGNASAQSTITTFDTKNSPFKNIFNYPTAFYIYFNFIDFNNNVLTDSFTDSDTSSEENTVYTYTYNDANYPLTNTESNDVAGNATTQYFYN